MTTIVAITGARRIKAPDESLSATDRFFRIVSALIAARLYQADVDSRVPHRPDAETINLALSAWERAEHRALELAHQSSACGFDRALISAARVAHMVLTTRDPDKLFVLAERINTAQHLLRRNFLGSSPAASLSAFLLAEGFNVLGRICDEALGATEFPEPDDSGLALTA